MGIKLPAILILLAVALVMSGCSYNESPPTPTTSAAPLNIPIADEDDGGGLMDEATPMPAIPEVPIDPTIPADVTVPLNVPTSNEDTPTSDEDVEARLIDQSWISPAMVQIGNFYPGARAEWNLRLHNGKNTEAQFLVSYRIPDSVKDGYTIAPPEAQDWVIIADPTPVLASKETKEILVVLAMPKEATVNNQKWEFWISVMEQGQGMVQTEMCSRWLVNMR